MATLVQPTVSRSTVSEDTAGLRISIPAQRSWTLLFLLGWLGAWTVGGTAAGRSLFHHFNLFILFWMCGWAFGEVAVGFTVFYALAGRQLIIASPESLTISTQIFGVGPARSYLAREIRNLRFRAQESAGRGVRASAIAFDYGAKTITFGAGIDEPEALDLIARIRQRCGISDTPQGSGTRFWG